MQSANSDDVRQVADVQALITERVDVIVIAPHNGEAMAKAVCGSCQVNSTCREFARSNHEYGFWGGEGEDERHAAGFRLIAPIGVRARSHAG